VAGAAADRASKAASGDSGKRLYESELKPEGKINTEYSQNSSYREKNVE